MPRRKPEKAQAGEIIFGDTSLSVSGAHRQSILAVVHSSKTVNQLGQAEKDRLIDAFVFAAGAAHAIDMSHMPTKENTKLEALMLDLFAQSVLPAWGEVGLKATITDNENGMSPLVAFVTDAAHAVGLGRSHRSLANSLRRAVQK